MQTLELDGTRDVSLSVEVLLDYILLSPSVTRPIYGHRPCKEEHLADELFLKCDHAIFQERGRGRMSKIPSLRELLPRMEEMRLQ